MSNTFNIGKIPIGSNYPCYVVAEIGINHDGKKEKAIKMIETAHAAGCQAVKFQLFSASRMYSINPGKFVTPNGKKQDIVRIIKNTELPVEWLGEFKKIAHNMGMAFFASVFDEAAADLMESVGADAYKLASYELTHIPLIQHVAKKKKPFIFSCGAGTLSEIEEALSTAKGVGQKNIVLMHCIAKYNAQLDDLNLRVIQTLGTCFPTPIIGYSDHSSDPVVAPTAAVVLGAQMIEKHITLDRRSPGPDHSFALEPKELSAMVKAIRKTESKVAGKNKVVIDERVLGITNREIYEVETYVRNFAYRSIFCTKPIKCGELFTSENIAVLRPGEKETGLHPRYYNLLINKHRSTQSITEGKAITWEDVLS